MAAGQILLLKCKSVIMITGEAFIWLFFRHPSSENKSAVTPFATDVTYGVKRRVPHQWKVCFMTDKATEPFLIKEKEKNVIEMQLTRVSNL